MSTSNQRPIKHFLFEVVVEGSGAFPFDMLRYDQCIPRTETDSVAMDHHKTSTRRVCLRHFSLDADGSITGDRWRSFGWVVVRILKVGS